MDNSSSSIELAVKEQPAQPRLSPDFSFYLYIYYVFFLIAIIVGVIVNLIVIITYRFGRSSPNHSAGPRSNTNQASSIGPQNRFVYLGQSCTSYVATANANTGASSAATTAMLNSPDIGGGLAGYKVRKTLASYFIISLGVCDLVICLLNMPLLLMLESGLFVDQILPAFDALSNFMNKDIVCRLSYFIIQIPITVDIEILLTIAFDRYASVFSPIQMYVLDSKKLKWVLLVHVIVACLLSSPNFYLFEYNHALHNSSTAVPLTLMSYCMISPGKLSAYRVYKIVLFALFIINLITIIVCYMRVYKHVYKVSRNHRNDSFILSSSSQINQNSELENKKLNSFFKSIINRGRNQPQSTSKAAHSAAAATTLTPNNSYQRASLLERNGIVDEEDEAGLGMLESNLDNQSKSQTVTFLNPDCATAETVSTTTTTNSSIKTRSRAPCLKEIGRYSTANSFSTSSTTSSIKKPNANLSLGQLNAGNYNRRVSCPIDCDAGADDKDSHNTIGSNVTPKQSTKRKSSNNNNSSLLGRTIRRLSENPLDINSVLSEQLRLGGAHTSINSLTSHSNTMIRRHTAKRLKHSKTAKILGFATLAFALTWCPYWLFDFQIFDIHFMLNQDGSDHGLAIIGRKFFYNTFYLNYVLNPVIYSFVNRRFRQNLLNMLRKAGRLAYNGLYLIVYGFYCTLCCTALCPIMVKKSKFCFRLNSHLTGRFQDLDLNCSLNDMVMGIHQQQPRRNTRQVTSRLNSARSDMTCDSSVICEAPSSNINGVKLTTVKKNAGRGERSAWTRFANWCLGDHVNSSTQTTTDVEEALSNSDNIQKS